MELQLQYKCIIGVNYPQPMVDFKEVSSKNRQTMRNIRDKMLEDDIEQPEHCRPSCDDEIRQFFWLSKDF